MKPDTDAKSICCPKCNSDDVQLGEYVYRRWHNLEIRDGTLMVQTSSDEVIWDASKDMALYCRECNHEWPVPEGLEIDWK